MDVKKKAGVVTGLTLAILLVTGNYLASRRFVRIDLTDNREYTLAPSTRKILRELRDVVQLRVYFSSTLPPQLTHIRRGVDDLVAEYRQYGGNNFTVEYRDPLADPQTERELLMMGIAPLQVNVVQRDKQEMARVYLGLVMLHGDKKEVIPVDPREPTRHLEEWFTGAIVKLTQDTTPVIGWWAPDHSPEGEGFSLVQALIGQRYTLQPVHGAQKTSDAALDPKTMQGLVLVAPAALTATDLRTIDRYLDAGGKVIALVNRIQVSEDFRGTALTTGLEPLLAAYGLTIPPRLVADAVNTYAAFRSGYVTYSVPYPLWPSARNEGLNRAHPVVGQLEALTLPWTSPIEAGDVPKALELTVLAKSSPLAGETPGDPPYSLDPQDAGLLLPNTPGTPRTLAVSLHGVFPDPFPETAKGNAPERAGAAGELIVVGTAHFAEDRFVGQNQFSEGVAFFSNMIDHFTIGDALVGIRSRPVTARPIPAQLTDGTKAGLRYANLLGVPMLIVLGGFGGLLARRRRWRRLRAQFQKA